MVILGIDPGIISPGFGIVKKENNDVSRNKIILIDAGVLKLASKQSINYRIGVLYDYFYDKIEKNSVNLIALETPFMGKNAQNFLKLGYVRGILYLLSYKFNIPIQEFSPREIKLSLTGYGGANKEQVARMVLKLFPHLIMPSQFDITDAIAISLCGAWKQKVIN